MFHCVPQVVRLFDGSTFLSHDLHLLESLEFKQRIKHIAEIIEEIKWEGIDPDVLTRYINGLGSFAVKSITYLIAA